MNKSSTYKLQCDCGALVEIRNGSGKCHKCGAYYGANIHKATKPRSRKKASYHHGLDWRDMVKVAGWIILIGIGLYLYQQFGIWFYVGGGAAVLLLTAWVKMVGKKGRKA